MSTKPQHTWFDHFSKACSWVTGRPATFILATLCIVVWLITGPIFKFSNTWQLVINTGTTIITFLMVFLIQHTQNRDTEAIHLKLDELIRAVSGARNSMIDLEEASEEQLMDMHKEYARLAQEAHHALGERGVEVPHPQYEPHGAKKSG